MGEHESTGFEHLAIIKGEEIANMKCVSQLLLLKLSCLYI